MQFNSFTFLIFFALALALFYSIRGTDGRKSLLLVSSYIFYAAWSPPFVLLLGASTFVDWLFANRIAAARTDRVRVLFLLGSLISNFGLLGYFKYGNFLLQNTTLLMGQFGIEYQPPAWDIVVPAGLSFYTFQSLSYTIDVYRRNIAPCKSLFDFALYVSFFPQLVAGPIVRASDFLSQCLHVKGATRDQFGWGLVLLLFGLFAKIVLADTLFAPVVDSFYASPSSYGTIEALFALAAFSGQIFYDFSAYSICAIGTALCFGFVLPDNFRAPYAAVGFSDFWRRWHISLSTWLRDYLYIPLGGNRSTSLRTSLNIMITMLLGGMWHGASWQFLIWGGIHGALLVIERFCREYMGSVSLLKTRPMQFIFALATFVIISFVWVFFRSPDLATTKEVMSALVGAGETNPVLADMMPYLFIALVGMILYHWLTRTKTLEEYIRGVDWRIRSLTAVCALSFLAFVDLGNEHAFIYFQF